jgi:hypothetical protein
MEPQVSAISGVTSIWGLGICSEAMIAHTRLSLDYFKPANGVELIMG